MLEIKTFTSPRWTKKKIILAHLMDCKIYAIRIFLFLFYFILFYVLSFYNLLQKKE